MILLMLMITTGVVAVCFAAFGIPTWVAIPATLCILILPVYLPSLWAIYREEIQRLRAVNGQDWIITRTGKVIRR